jgi:hypothetical protein
MMALIQHNAVPIVISLVIGLATGWWMYRGARRQQGPKE